MKNESDFHQLLHFHKMPSKTPNLYMIVYTGLDLDEKAAILRTFLTREETFSWLEKLARNNGVPPKRMSTDADVYEVMEDHYNIGVQGWDYVKENPEIFGNWEATSLKALVNHDFSVLNEKRWKELKKNIKFPTLGDVSDDEEEESEDSEENEIVRKNKEAFAKIEISNVKVDDKEQELVATHAKSGKQIPIVGYKSAGGKTWGVTPDGKNVPILSRGIKSVPKAKISKK